MGATEIIRRELPHLSGILIDGFIWTMTPTLTFISSQLPDGFPKVCCNASVVFLGALGGFRSKAFGDWRDGKRKRDEETALVLKQATERKSEADGGNLR